MGPQTSHLFHNEKHKNHRDDTGPTLEGKKTGPLFQLSPKSSGHTGHGAGAREGEGDAARVQIKAKSHSVCYEDGGR